MRVHILKNIGWDTDPSKRGRMTYDSQSERRQWIITNLNAGVELTTNMLEKRFEVAKSTAQRDFKHYQNQGRVELNKNTHIWKLLDKTYPLPDLYISQKEWTALLISEQLLSTQSSELSQNLLKLVKRYRDSMSPLVFEKQIREGVSSCLTDFEEIPEAVFQTCLTAIFQKQVLAFQYYKPLDNSHTNRSVSPQHLVLHNGKWMLISWDHQANALRNFMPSRIREISVQPEQTHYYIREEEINEYLNSSYGIFKGKKRQTVELLFSKRMSYLADKRIWHPYEEKSWIEDQLLLKLPVASEIGILQEIRSFGPDVEVLKPLTLRDKIRQELEKTVEIYKK